MLRPFQFREYIDFSIIYISIVLFSLLPVMVWCTRTLAFQSWLCHDLYLRNWASYLTSLNHHFFIIYEMEDNTPDFGDSENSSLQQAFWIWSMLMSRHAPAPLLLISLWPVFVRMKINGHCSCSYKQSLFTSEVSQLPPFSINHCISFPPIKHQEWLDRHPRIWFWQVYQNLSQGRIITSI